MNSFLKPFVTLYKIIVCSDLSTATVAYAITFLSIYTATGKEDFMLPAGVALLVFSGYTFMRLMQALPIVKQKHREKQLASNNSDTSEEATAENFSKASEDSADKVTETSQTITTPLSRITAEAEFIQSMSPKMRWHIRYFIKIAFVSLLAFGGAVYLARDMRFDVRQFFLVCALVMLFYDKYPLALLYKSYTGLKGRVWLKLPTLLGVWVAVVLVVPYISYKVEMDMRMMLYTGFALVWLVSNAFLFELRDFNQPKDLEGGNFFANYSFSTGMCVLLSINLMLVLPFLYYEPMVKNLIESEGYATALLPSYFLVPNIVHLLLMPVLMLLHRFLRRFEFFFFLADLSLCIPWILYMAMNYSFTPEILYK